MKLVALSQGMVWWITTGLPYLLECMGWTFLSRVAVRKMRNETVLRIGGSPVWFDVLFMNDQNLFFAQLRLKNAQKSNGVAGKSVRFRSNHRLRSLREASW